MTRSGPGPGLAALIPIRSFQNGKTRLAGAFSSAERAALGRWMLARVAGAARESGSVETIAVVSPDAEVLAAAPDLAPGIVPLPQDPATPGLNAALDQGRTWANEHGAGALLILFGDLPLLTARDVRDLAAHARPIVLAPDRHGAGTNALLLRGNWPPAARFRFQFGPDSFARHVAEARRLGAEPLVATARGTALDLDTPADYALVGARGWGLGAGEQATRVLVGILQGDES